MKDYLKQLSERDDKILQRVIQLPLLEQKILYCALCCERLEPIYHTYLKAYKTDEQQPIEILRRVWDFLSGEPIPAEVWQRDVETLIFLMDNPKIEENSLWNILGSYFVFAVLHTVGLLISMKEEADHLKQLSEITTAATYNFIEMVTRNTSNLVGREFEEKIRKWVYSAPAVDLEIWKQLSDIKKIETAGDRFGDEIEDLRKFNQTFGINPFQLGLVVYE